MVWDYDFKAIWYSSSRSTDTSFTVPASLLQPNTPYIWEVLVWDSKEDPQNRHVSERFCFYTGTKSEPEITSEGLLSVPLWDTNLFNYAYARAINVAPWDINYFKVTGPNSVLFDLIQARFYGFQFPVTNGVGAYLDPPTQSIPNGTYTVEIEDTSGHIVNSGINYAYNPVPAFTEDSRLPAENTYFDTDTPSFSWSRVEGDTGDGSYRYSIRIVDYADRLRWYDSSFSADTSFTLPEDLNLPKGSSYKWRLNVLGPATGDGTNWNNYRATNYRTFTINEVFPSATPALTLTIDGELITLEWNDVTGATEYILLYSPYPYAGPETIMSINMGTQTSISAKFWQGAAFYVAVQAKNSAGSSPYSNIELILIQ